MDEPRESESHRLIGGELCLDFANTVNGHARPTQHEYLHDFRDVLVWGRRAGALSVDKVGVLLREADRRPGEAKAIYSQALELRETIFRIFAALAGGRPTDGSDLARLNSAWREGQGHARLIHSGDGFSLGWDDEPCLDHLLRSVAASAIGLLVSPQVGLIRTCAGEHCDWLFVDTSRNHLRRWCSMEECGNRAKMQRRQAKQKLNVAP